MKVNERIKTLEDQLKKAKVIKKHFPNAEYGQIFEDLGSKWFGYMDSSVNPIADKCFIALLDTRPDLTLNLCDDCSKLPQRVFQVEPYLDLEENIIIYSNPTFFYVGDRMTEYHNWKEKMKEKNISDSLIYLVEERIRIGEYEHSLLDLYYGE